MSSIGHLRLVAIHDGAAPFFMTTPMPKQATVAQFASSSLQLVQARLFVIATAFGCSAQHVPTTHTCCLMLFATTGPEHHSRLRLVGWQQI